MRQAKFTQIYKDLPTKRKRVLDALIKGDNREKIMTDLVISEQALTQHKRQLYKNFEIDTNTLDVDDPRMGERKLHRLIALVKDGLLDGDLSSQKFTSDDRETLVKSEILLSQHYLSEYTEEELLFVKQARELAKNKITIDFNSSPITTSRLNRKNALRNIVNKLSVADITRSQDIVDSPMELLTTFSVRPSDDDILKLKEYGQILIGCPSYHAATILVLKRIKNEYGLDMKICHENVNGRDLIFNLNSQSKKYDFLIIANSPMLFSVQEGNKSVAEYELCFLCFYSNQYVFKLKKTKIGSSNRIFFAEETSLDEQIRYFNGHSSIILPKERKIIDFGELPDYIDCLDKDEMVIVWEPMDNIVRKNPLTEEVPELAYKTWISLYTHKDWHESQQCLLKNFRHIFIIEWKYCQRQWQYSQLTQDSTFDRYLADDMRYLLDFARASAITTDGNSRDDNLLYEISKKSESK
jgi:hypothetical protein